MAVALRQREVEIDGGLRGTWTAPAASELAGPAPCVVMFHGFGGRRDEVGGLFARLAARLAAREIASLRFDFPGCGQSAGRFDDITVALYAAAAEAALRFARNEREADAERVALLGYSFGGAIATTRLGSTRLGGAAPVPALALWAPVGNPRVDMVETLGAARAEEAARTGWVAVPWGAGEIRLKHAFFAGLADAAPLDAIAAFPGDVYVAAGSRDRLAKYVPAFCAAARRARSCRTHLFDGVDHFFRDLDGGTTAAEILLDETTDFFASGLGAA
ncbi:MAG: alpha/beta hydrolase [Rhodospirillaceae bacterium]|nr:alpha/beta hydrolase [Rhodospirillaceae bacterium]